MELSITSLETDPYDVIIVGGGPAGATAALYTARADLRTLIIDKGATAGALGKAAQIANYPGVPGPIGGDELVRQMREQAVSFDAEIVTDKVLRADLQSSPKQVWTGQGVYEGRAIIIATGSMGRTNRIQGEESLLGRGVSYCATCDGAFFREKEVAVVGNNDEAVEEALTLARFATKVHLLNPTTELDASPEAVRDLDSQSNIFLLPNTRVLEILGDNKVEAVRTRDDQREEYSIPVSGAFIYLQGNLPVTDFLDGQLETDDIGCLLVDESYQTAIPGVFAAGDVLCKHVKQVVVAAGEGASAAIAADRFLRKRKKLRPDWAK